MIILEARSAREGGALNFTVELFPRVERLLADAGHDVVSFIGPPRSVAERVRRRLAYTTASAILHAGNRATFSLRARRVVCVRDRLLLEPDLPPVNHALRYRVRRRLLAIALGVADVVVVPSDSMMSPLDRFRRRYGVRERPCEVILHGRPRWPSPAPRPLNDPLRLLFTSSALPHKNFPLLARLVREAANRGINVRLTITTSEDQESGSRPLGDVFGTDRRHVDFIGPVPREQLPSLYETHDVLLFPSLFEAFGLPLIEAMVMNMPIVVSDRDWAHEVCADAALYADPLEATPWVDALEVIVGAGERSNSAGVTRAELFDWDEAARVYATLLVPTLRSA